MSFSFAQILQSKEHQNLSGKLRPSGRFSFAQIFPKKRKTLNEVQYRKTEEIELLMLRFDAANPEASKGERSAYMHSLLTTSPEASRKIGLSNAPNSGKRAKRGAKGIRAGARDRICWAASQLEFAHGRSNMSFLTLTIPDVLERQLIAIQDNWSVIVNEVVREIRRRLKARGIPTHVVGCTELQPERSLREGLNFPHLHLVFRGRRHRKAKWGLTPSAFRGIWRTCIQRFVPDLVDGWAASENVQAVRDTASGYLAKYISKGGSTNRGHSPDPWHPAHYEIISRALRSLYERLSYVGYEVGLQCLSWVENWKPEMGWVRPIEIETKCFGTRRIGYFGWLKGETRYVSAMNLFALI
jgi:hypothetical protein